MFSNRESQITRAHKFYIAAFLLLIYIAIRIAALPSNLLLSQGMSHDAAYLAMVAKNLLAGKGFVLDSLWLVFLQPDHLPMPFHNANPLYPVSIALTSKLTGWDVVRSGFLISALSSAGIVLAMTIILLRFVESPFRAAAIACGVMLFPVIWNLSWENVTDEYSLMLLLVALALLFRGEGLAAAAGAGVFFGLSWLARSMVVTTLPAIGVWILLQFGWRKGMARVMLFGAAAFAVCVPWFLHNLHTWGDPFRSDNGYLASISFYYRFIYGASARAWFSPEVPEALGRLVREHPVEIGMNWLHSLPVFFKVVVTGVTGASYLKLAVLALLAGALAFRNRSSLLSREGAAFGVYLVMVLLLMSGMGGMMEPRYFMPGYAVFAAWLLVNVAELRWQDGVVSRGGLILAGVYIVFLLAASDVRSARFYRQPDEEEKVPLMRVATDVNQTISHGAPVVVGFHPYLYSIFTGAQSLAIPQSDDAYLLSYMRKYHACCILLSEQERAFWRPQWSTALPPHVFLIRSMEGYNVYGVDR